MVEPPRIYRFLPERQALRPPAERSDGQGCASGHLSVYLGHVRPQESYWYLTATPQLLGKAAERFQQYAGLGGTIMKNSHSSLIAPHVKASFGVHLTQHKRVSPQTLASMRDSFRLLLQFLHQATGVGPALLRIADLNARPSSTSSTILRRSGTNSVRSRNIRLCSIRSFMRLVALRDPESLNLVAAVLAIPVKREDRKLIGYLTREEIEAILAAPDRCALCTTPRPEFLR